LGVTVAVVVTAGGAGTAGVRLTIIVGAGAGGAYRIVVLSRGTGAAIIGRGGGRNICTDVGIGGCRGMPAGRTGCP